VSEEKQSKVIKETTKMFKSMVPALGGVTSLTDLVLTIVEASGVLAPLQAVLDVILGLFGILGAQVIPVLMTAIQPLIGFLLQMAPIFTLIGQVIGVLVAVALIPFQLSLNLWMAILIPLLPIFDALIQIFIALTPLIFLFTDLLIALLPVFNPIILIIQLLTPAIQLLADVITLALGPLDDAQGGIKLFTDWINNLVSLLEGSLKFALNFVIGIFQTIGGLLSGGFMIAITAVAIGIATVINAINTAVQTFDLFDVIRDFSVTVPSFQEGTDFVQNTGLAQLHAGERVVSNDQNARLVEGIETLIEQNNQRAQEERRRVFFEGARR